ncbi:MAG: IPT/TIG domain-containing protein [Bacteroidales bacterium]|jgi:hypothetical protein|nr:IPT/TIG domain-containing protein [Bacteroidales bacterium]
MKKVVMKIGNVFRDRYSPSCACGLVFLFLAACGEKDGSSSNPYDRPHNPAQAVEIKSVSPVSGGMGAKVIIAGSNFGNDTAGVQLYFNQKKALILNIQDNAIYALVPRQPGDFSTVKVVINDRETLLDGMQFQYFIRAVVTTVSGKLNVSESVDGPALQATYTRPVIPCAKKDGSLVFIADDWGGNKVRMLSVKDNMVTTVIDGLSSPWQMAFNPTEDRLYVVEREQANRPILFYALSQKTNWVQREIYYDQIGEDGNYVAGNMPTAGLAADDTYVYMMSREKLIRIHQTTKKVEALSGVLLPGSWNYPIFNKRDRKLYVVTYDESRVYRLDPYYIPEGRTTPWITMNEMEHIAGMSPGAAREGNGKNIRFGYIEISDFDEEGNLYIPDDYNHVIWKLDPELNGTIIAGTIGTAFYKDGDPLEAQFNYPYGVSVTRDGLIYVGDQGNKLVRCIAIQ